MPLVLNTKTGKKIEVNELIASNQALMIKYGYRLIDENGNTTTVETEKKKVKPLSEKPAVAAKEETNPK